MRSIGASILVITLVSLAGCNQAKSPDAVQRDVNSAASSGEKSIARAERREQRTDNSAEQNAANALNRDTDKEVNAALNTALAHAEAEHKVALAQCEGYSGDQQKSCKAQADAAWEDAKARAKEIKKQE
jgi:hypothetical protein